MSYNPIITVNTHINDTNQSLKVHFGFGGGATGTGMSFWNPCTEKFDRFPGWWEFIRNTALGALGGFFAGLEATSGTVMGAGRGLAGDAIVNIGNYSNSSSPSCSDKPICE